MSKQDIFVFGHFGFFTDRIDGQIVKTRMVHELLEDRLGVRIPCFDTGSIKVCKPGLIIAFVRILRIKHLIYLPAQNSLKFFFPLLYVLSRISGFKIHYFVIGGWLPQFVAQHPITERYLKRIKKIYVESHKMDKLLHERLFPNSVWFPNFRFESNSKCTKEKDNNLNLVFMSRISKKKGIDTIFSFMDTIQDKNIYERIRIDYYGTIDEADREYFRMQLNFHKTNSYKGVASPASVQQVLANYDLLLFPTRYEGEGCPGIIIDAFFAGVPVLATDWKYNSEYITDGKTGYLIQPNDINSLRGIIMSLLRDKSSLVEMGINAKKISRNFDANYAWGLIKSELT